MFEKQHKVLKIPGNRLSVHSRLCKNKASPYARILLFLMIANLLASCVGNATLVSPSPTEALPSPSDQTVKQATGGVLRLFSAEAHFQLNPHLTSNGNNLDASRITYEPLASFDKDGVLIPILAAEIPSLENGGVASDGKSVTWKLKQNVLWSDEKPFTAEDVLFTYQYITNPDVKSTNATTYSAVKNVEILDQYTIKVNFSDVTPAWYIPFVGWAGVILPKHKFEAFNGSNAQDAPANILPVGTGPYYVVAPGIKPQEVWLLGTQLIKTTKIVYKPNPYYREKDLPLFSRIELLGGGRPDEAEKLVLDEQIIDIAFIRGQILPETLAKLENSTQAKLVITFGTIVERILLNHTDPNQEIGGERSSLKTSHPFFSDKKVRQALAYAIDRETIAKLFGPTGKPTTNNLVSPPQFNSPHVYYEYNLDKARQLLDEAEWKDTDGDKIRDKEGVKLKIVFQSPLGGTDEQIQKIVKSSLNSIGIDVELKLTDPSAMFGSPLENPDSAPRFNADLMAFSIGSPSIDPGPFMRFWTCEQIPQKGNDWSAVLNFERWCNSTYDALYQQSVTEMDPEKRQRLFIEMNDLLVEDVAMIPLAIISYNSALVKTNLSGIDVTPWDMLTWNIKDWRRTSP